MTERLFRILGWEIFSACAACVALVEWRIPDPRPPHECRGVHVYSTAFDDAGQPLNLVIEFRTLFEAQRFADLCRRHGDDDQWGLEQAARSRRFVMFDETEWKWYLHQAINACR